MKEISNIYVEKKMRVEGKPFETYTSGLFPVSLVNPSVFQDKKNVVAVRYIRKSLNSDSVFKVEKLTDWIYFGKRVTFEELQNYYKNKPYYKQAHYLVKKMQLLNFCKRDNELFLMNISDLTIDEYNAIYNDNNSLRKVWK